MDNEEIQSVLDSPEFQQRVLSQFMETWVSPEVTKRQIQGELEKPLILTKAQIIFFPDERAPEIRINSEVKAGLKVKVKPEYDFNDGDLVYSHQIEEIQELYLDQEDDPDCGYIILLNLGGTWILKFDFRYNNALSKQHLLAARQFLAAAKFSMEQQNWIAFIDVLFSAVELTAKAQLLSYFAELRQNHKHDLIHSRYNLFAHTGNVPENYRDIYNQLWQLRIPIRYLRTEFSLSKEEIDELYNVVSEMIEYTSSRLGQ